MKALSKGPNPPYSPPQRATWACPFLPLLTPDVGKGPKYWKSPRVQRKTDVTPENLKNSDCLQ